MSRKARSPEHFAPRASFRSCIVALIVLTGFANLASAQSWDLKTKGKNVAIAVYEVAKGSRVAFECPSRSGGGGPSLSITRDLVVDLGARWAGYATASDLIIGPPTTSANNLLNVPKGSRGAAAFVPIPATGWVTHDFFGDGFDEILSDVATTTLTLKVGGRKDIAIPLAGLLPYLGQLRDACSRTSLDRFVLPVRRWIGVDDIPDRLHLERPFLGRHVGFFTTGTYGNPHAMTPVFERLAGSECAGLVVATDLYYAENWEIGRKEERTGLGFRPSSNFKQEVMRSDCARGGRAIIVGRWNDDNNSRVFYYRGRQLSFEQVKAMVRMSDTWSGDLPGLAAALDRMAQDDGVPAEATASSPAFDDITDDRAGIGWSFDGKVAIAPLGTRSERPPVRGVADLPEACLSAPGLTRVGGIGTANLEQIDTLLNLVGLRGRSMVRIECGEASAILPIVTEITTNEGNSWRILDTPNSEYIESIIKKKLETKFKPMIERGSIKIEESSEGHIRIISPLESEIDNVKSSFAYTIAKTTVGARSRLIVRVSADSDQLQNLLIEAFRRAGLRVPFDPGRHAIHKDWPVYTILNDVDRVYFRKDADQIVRGFTRIHLLDLSVKEAQLNNQRAVISRALGEESREGSANLEYIKMPEYSLRVNAASTLLP